MRTILFLLFFIATSYSQDKLYIEYNKKMGGVISEAYASTFVRISNKELKTKFPPCFFRDSLITVIDVPEGATHFKLNSTGRHHKLPLTDIVYDLYDGDVEIYFVKLDVDLGKSYMFDVNKNKHEGYKFYIVGDTLKYDFKSPLFSGYKLETLVADKYGVHNKVGYGYTYNSKNNHFTKSEDIKVYDVSVKYEKEKIREYKNEKNLTYYFYINNNYYYHIDGKLTKIDYVIIKKVVDKKLVVSCSTKCYRTEK